MDRVVTIAKAFLDDHLWAIALDACGTVGAVGSAGGNPEIRVGVALNDACAFGFECGAPGVPGHDTEAEFRIGLPDDAVVYAICRGGLAINAVAPGRIRLSDDAISCAGTIGISGSAKQTRALRRC